MNSTPLKRPRKVVKDKYFYTITSDPIFEDDWYYINSGSRDYDGGGSIRKATKEDVDFLSNKPSPGFTQETADRVNMAALVGSYYCKIVKSNNPELELL
jgi:hypothetical protein